MTNLSISFTPPQPPYPIPGGLAADLPNLTGYCIPANLRTMNIPATAASHIGTPRPVVNLLICMP